MFRTLKSRVIFYLTAVSNSVLKFKEENLVRPKFEGSRILDTNISTQFTYVRKTLYFLCSALNFKTTHSHNIPDNSHFSLKKNCNYSASTMKLTIILSLFTASLARRSSPIPQNIHSMGKSWQFFFCSEHISLTKMRNI